MQKLLRINFVLPRPSLSGGIKSNRLIAEAMVRRGHHVCILYPSVPARTPPIRRVFKLIRYWVNRYKSRNKQKHHLEESTAQLIPVFHRPIYEDDAPDADITIATWWETAHWIKGWPESKGKKAYFIRGYELYGGDSNSVIETYKLPFKKLVIASWLKRLMNQKYADSNVTLVPNGVDWKQFNFQLRAKQVVPTIGFLYGIVALKGAETAFEAIHRVQSKIPNLRVICFGSQPIGSVQRLPDNFEYHFRPNQDVIPQLYRETDCWLVPSTLEGFGMPGLEAAACGSPVVTTKCGGPEDYVKHGHNGYLVDVGDVEAMAEYIYKIVTMDPQSWKQMSCNSAEYVKRFDWDVSAGILEQSLFELVRRDITHLDDQPTSNKVE